MTDLFMITSSAKARNTSLTTDIWSRGTANTRWSVLRLAGLSATWQLVKALCASSPGLVPSLCRQETPWYVNPLSMFGLIANISIGHGDVHCRA